MKPILIAGIGNIFHGDDGFGVCVARRMAQSPLPEEVDVVDFGIRGLDLAYALTGGYRLAVLIDAVQRGEPPGTLYVIEPEVAATDMTAPDDAGISPHEMDPASVLRLARIIGGDECASVMLVGCEPETFGNPEDGDRGLSADVAAAVDKAAAMAVALVADWLRDKKLASAHTAHEELIQ